MQVVRTIAAGALALMSAAAQGQAYPAKPIRIVVPFAAAVDDHQTRNAQFLVKADAARLIPENELTPQRLAAELKALMVAGRDKLLSMAERAREEAIVDADVRLADACIAAAGGVR